MGLYWATVRVTSVNLPKEMNSEPLFNLSPQQDVLPGRQAEPGLGACSLPTIYKSPVGEEGEEERGPGYPASLLVTSEDFLWGRSCGVGMWSPVTRFLSGPALGSCLFFILALAML